MADRFRPFPTPPLALAALMALAACDPDAPRPSPESDIALPGGLAPTHGRTEAEREAARAYYRGPRGDEF